MQLSKNQRGEGTSGALVAIALLVIAIVAVVLLWMNDRSSQDASLEVNVGIEAAPTAPLLTRIS